MNFEVIYVLYMLKLGVIRRLMNLCFLGKVSVKFMKDV